MIQTVKRQPWNVETHIAKLIEYHDGDPSKASERLTHFLSRDHDDLTEGQVKHLQRVLDGVRKQSEVEMH